MSKKTLIESIPQEKLALINLVQMLHPLRQEGLDHIIRNSSLQKVKKGKFLLRPGQICDQYYFIFKGAIRAFIKQGNKEITTWINTDNAVATSIRSMALQEPSLEYLQAVEDCSLVVMSYEGLQEIYDLYPEMNTVGRILITRYYADAEERAYISRIPNAYKRYDHFVNSQPERLSRLPLKYIASYLGMTVETLSRLRAKKAKDTI